MRQRKLANYVPDCASGGRSYETSYKELKSILYPVNVARNIARESAATHFVFPSDIELYPREAIQLTFLNLGDFWAYFWDHFWAIF